MSRVAFISHSSEDKKIGEEVCRFLEKHGVQCWIAPRNVTPGKNYGAAILDAIDECRVFVLILSGSSNKSGQVVREVERAASTGAIIIPFLIETVQPSRDLEFYVSAAHWLDASSKPLEKHLRELLSAIQDWLKGSDDRKGATKPAATPPSLPASAPPAATSVTRPAWLPFAIIGGAVALILVAMVAWKLSHRSIPTSSTAPAPSPTLAPVPAPSAEVKLATASPPPAPSEPPMPPRRRPGEPLHSLPSPAFEASATSSPPSVRLRPGRPFAPGNLAINVAPSASPNQYPAPLIGEVVASSELEFEGKKHRPSFAFDGDLETAWITKGEGEGQSITIHFKTPATISSVSILNSASNSPGVYRNMSHLHTLRMKLSDGSVQMLTFENKPGWRRFELPEPKTTEWALFEIVTTFPGEKRKSVPIAEIAFNRAPDSAGESAEAPPTIPPASSDSAWEIIGSSQHDNHAAQLAFDGNTTTCWVTDTDGIGQTLRVNFKTPVSLTSVSIVNGNAKDPEHFQANNRVWSLRLRWSDGATQVLSLADKMGAQHFALQHRAPTNSITFEILSIYPGARNNWAALSEIAFNRDASDSAQDRPSPANSP